MRKLSRITGSLRAIVVSVLIVACDNPRSAIPPSPIVPAVESVDISGPSTIAPGQSAQFTANIRLSNGSVKTASPATNVRWLASNLSRLRVDTSGLATGQQQLGDAILTAEVRLSNGAIRRSTKEIVVVPEGTFRLVGQVVDSEFPTTPLSGARVEVTPGGLVATTNFEGRYTLHGVPSDATVRIIRVGYVNVEQSVHLTAHATQDFRMDVSGPRLALGGPYTLAIDVTGACSGGSLPAEAQHRRYDAVLTQTGLTVDVTLTEPRFRLNSLGRGNRFSGRVDGASATFTLDAFESYYYPYYGPTSYPNIAERLSDGTVLVVQGAVVTTGSAAGLFGQMNSGSFLIRWDSRFPTNSMFLGSCNFASPLMFTLTPR